MEIRFGTQEDIPRIAEMIRGLKYHIKPRNWSLEKIRNLIQRRLKNPERYFYLLIDIGSNVIGVIGADIKNKNRVYLTGGYVETTYRRRGIMRQLEDKFTKILRTKGIKRVDLDVVAHNIEGTKTWLSLGYKTIKTLDLKNTSKLIMRKEIE